MDSIGSPSLSSYHPLESLEASKKVESHEVSGQPNSPERKDSNPRQSQEIPHIIVQLPNVPCQQRPPEDVALRKQENVSLDHEEQLQKQLLLMSKGMKRNSRVPKSILNAVDAGSKVVDAGLKNKGKIGENLPFGVGSTIEAISERKKASKCRAEAKALEAELKGEPLPRKEARIIKNEIKLKKAELKNLLAEVKDIDREMAKDYKARDREPLSIAKMHGQIQQREALLSVAGDLSSHVKALRCKLYTAPMSAEEKEQKIDALDQKVREQKQHARKGYGHGSRGVGGGAYTALTGLKVASVAADVAVAGSALTPITAGVGLVAGGTGLTLDARNLVKAGQSLQMLKDIKTDARACKARALYHATMATDSHDPATQHLHFIKGLIETEVGQHAKDFIQIEKKVCHRKIVINSVNVAEHSLLVVACSASLATMIPEPTTSATMYVVALSATGMKYGTMLGGFLGEKGSELLEERHQNQLQGKTDFGDDPKHSKGISKSHLGVDIRLAAMIKNGIALPSVVKYHKIIDEVGFVNHMEEFAREKGDKQELKKGKAVINDFAAYTNNYYSNLTAQLPDEKAA